MRRIVATTVLFSCAACQAYSPMELTPSREGAPVRVTLTSSGSAQMASALGGPVDYLDGQLGAVTDSTVTVSVTELTRVSGIEETWKGERVVIPRADVASASRRTTSVARSIAGGAILIGGAYLIGRGFGGGKAEGPTDRGLPPGTVK